MPPKSPPPVVFVVESLQDDETMTLRALARLPFPIKALVERTGDRALDRYERELVEHAPRLVVVSDRLLYLETPAFVRGVRAVHPVGQVPILHLLESEDHAPAEGVDAWLAKPVGYYEYLASVGRAALALIRA